MGVTKFEIADPVFPVEQYDLPEYWDGKRRGDPKTTLVLGRPRLRRQERFTQHILAGSLDTLHTDTLVPRAAYGKGSRFLAGKYKPGSIVAFREEELVAPFTTSEPQKGDPGQPAPVPPVNLHIRVGSWQSPGQPTALRLSDRDLSYSTTVRIGVVTTHKSQPALMTVPVDHLRHTEEGRVDVLEGADYRPIVGDQIGVGRVTNFIFEADDGYTETLRRINYLEVLHESPEAIALPSLQIPFSGSLGKIAAAVSTHFH